jgi:hypothetical protein
LHLLLDNTRPTTFLGDNIQTLEKHESRATLRTQFFLSIDLPNSSVILLHLAGQMFPCSSMVRWRVSSKLRAHTYVGIHFPSHSETLNERQPYMMEIPQWIRKALLSSERSRGVVCVRSLARGSIAGQSPTELGMLSSPLKPALMFLY